MRRASALSYADASKKDSVVVTLPIYHNPPQSVVQVQSVPHATPEPSLFNEGLAAIRFKSSW